MSVAFVISHVTKLEGVPGVHMQSVPHLVGWVVLSLRRLVIE